MWPRSNRCGMNTLTAGKGRKRDGRLTEKALQSISRDLQFHANHGNYCQTGPAGHSGSSQERLSKKAELVDGPFLGIDECQTRMTVWTAVRT